MITIYIMLQIYQRGIRSLSNLVSRFKNVVEKYGGKGIIFIKSSNEELFLSYKDLYKKSLEFAYLAKASGLKRGDKLILQFNDNEKFLISFWGSIIGGIIPVPLDIENLDNTLNVFNVLEEAKIITDLSTYSTILKEIKESQSIFIDANCIIFENLIDQSIIQNIEFVIEDISENDTAFIQFSSGTTGVPKGVVLSHKNLLTNIYDIVDRCELTNNEKALSWLPLTHNMGLIGLHMTPLLIGVEQCIMNTEVFMRNPVVWMEKANEYKSTILASPNFGYIHFMQHLKTKNESEFNWDLSSIRIIYNGAESISLSVVNEFCDYMQKWKLKKEVMYPVYGLAEATLAVTFPDLNTGISYKEIDRDNIKVASKINYTDEYSNISFPCINLGYAMDNCNLKICDDQGNELGEEHTGHIIVSGNSIMSGYYKNNKEKKAILDKDGNLNTGDLGFISDGNLYIIGRSKEMIIINGKNYYPKDIEMLLYTSIKDIEANKVIAVSVNHREEKESLAIFIESEKDIESCLPVIDEIRTTLFSRLKLKAEFIIVVKEIKKTSSGKLQRLVYKRNFENNEYDDIINFIANKQSLSMKEKYIPAKTNLERKVLDLVKKELKTDLNFGLEKGLYDLGFDSLQISRLVNNIENELRVRLTLEEVLAIKTLKSLCDFLSELEKTDQPESQKLDESEYYPTSSAQKRIYTINRTNPLSTDYNITQSIILNCEIDDQQFKKAYDNILKLHDILFTSYHLEGGEIVQKVHKNRDSIFEYHEVKSDNEINGLIDGFVKPFDIVDPPLIRGMLIKINNIKYCFTIDVHHIAADGISLVTIFKQIINSYEGTLYKKNSIQQKDIVITQRESVEANNAELKEYWNSIFQGEIPVIDLPFDNPIYDMKNNKAERYVFSVDNGIAIKLKEIARLQKVSTFSLLLASFYILLNKVTGQKDIVIAVPIAGRKRYMPRDIVGMFVNTVPFRINFDDNGNLEDLIQTISADFKKTMEYQDYDIENLVEDLKQKKEVNRNFLFDVMFSYYSLTFGSDREYVEKYNYKNNDAQFFITMNVEDRRKDLSVEIEYYKDLFNLETIERLAETYLKLLDSIICNFNSKIKDLDSVTEYEKDLILNKFNSNKVELPDDASIYHLIEENVSRIPNKAAIIFKSKEITYDEMNSNANRIGHMLVEAGLKIESKVGILLERNPMMLESILGIWKVGGAYIPIDVTYPLERISDIYEMSQAEFLITESKYLSFDIKKKLHNVKIICMDEITLENYPKSNLNIKYNTDCIAYIIFTSGSTGKPKGAIVEQIGMYNHMIAKINDLNLNEDSVILQSASHCFDISVWQFFAALVCGGTTVIIPNESVFEINEYLHLINQHNISIVQVVPSFLNVIIKKFNEKPQNIDSLRYMIVTGERVNSDTVSNWFKLNTGIPLVNAYGPTEAADDITHYIMYDDPKELNISVGRPIQNMNIYIVNDHMKLCGIGVRGEICTSGIGVGRGYIGDEEKTNKVFVKDPFQSNYPYRMYKTGDIGRWLPNGNIEFLERKDYQVKIHGYRIELGEIETKVLENKQIREVKVLDKENDKNEKFLCAYFVSQEEVDIEELKQEIGNKLPKYMVPQYFIKIDKMPISANGKVERKVLLSIPIQTVEKKYVKPQSWTQKKIALIWKEVLELDEIGIEDNFFEVGGHSLKAITMMDYFQNEFDIDFNINDVFNYDTIAKQAVYIDGEKNNRINDIVDVIPKNTLDEYELSSAQKRIFAVSQAEGEHCIAYNMPALFRIEGQIEYSKVERVFKDLINRHSNLRVNFKLSEDNVTQIINNNVDFILDKIYIDEYDTQKIYSKLVKPFDIFNEPLFRAFIITNKENQNFLFIDMHHIISDGVSITILVDEFVKLYDNKKLNVLEYGYCDFIAWQKTKSKELEDQEQYWTDKFSDNSQRMQLVTDYTRGATNSFEGKNQTFVLDKENTKKLKKIAMETESTLFMVLMTAYKVLLYKYTNNKDIIVGTVSAGRRRKEFRDIVGMFVNTIPIKTTLKEDYTFKSYLEIVKKAILEGLSNEEYQFNDLVEKLHITRDSNSNPIFDVLFVMQDDYVDTLKSEHLTLKHIDFKNTISKFDLEFQVTEIENELLFDLSYKSTLYKDETITNFLNHYKEIIRQIIEESNISIEEVEIITDREKELIKSFNNTWNDYKSNISIIDLFESNVKRNNKARALSLDDKSITYKELNDRANQRARKLMEKGISSGDVVAIMMDDSIEMIDCILGILKLGAVYLPIDTKLPIKRIELMLIETEAKLLIYDDFMNTSFDALLPIININEDISTYSKENLYNDVNGDKLACIIYTSGTSGMPKGSLVMHKNIIRVVYRTNYVEFAEQDVILQTANYGFDGSFFNIYGALLNGSELVLCSRKNLLELNYISNVVKEKKVTKFFVTTALFNIWTDNIPEAFADVECIVFGGEKASEKHCKKALQYLKNGYIINGYGPTESTVFTTAYVMNRLEDVTDTIPIGKVITNTQVCILSSYGKAVPIGVPGELCISGNGLVQGYLKNVELTNEKFTKNPMDSSSIIYRTGDLARWTESGNIEFLGRIDNQVKINGYRIELEEIESNLKRHKAINEAVVIAKENEKGEKYLIAYVLSEGGDLNTKAIKEWLMEFLPKYMIPKNIVVVDKMPLNKNGKVDRNELQKLEEEAKDTTSIVYDENNMTTKQNYLIEVSQKVLGKANINLNDDFFEMGGDSIKAIQLSASLKKKGIKLDVKDIFIKSVMHEMAYCCEDLNSDICQEPIIGEVKLLPNAKYFINNNDVLNYFTQSIVLDCKEKLEPECLRKAFKQLLVTHDMLRASYKNNSIWLKDIDEEQLFELNIFDCSNQSNADEYIVKKIEEIKASTNLETGPLVKAAVFNMSKTCSLMISIHHFVVDTVSFRILIEDLLELYRGYLYGEEYDLPSKTNSFRDWVSSLEKYVQSSEFKSQEEYWSEADKEIYTEIKGKATLAKRLIGNMEKCQIELSDQLTLDLLQKVNKPYNTETKHVLIAAIGMAINKVFNVEDNTRILLEGHGREELFDNIDLSRTVGWFTSLYPVILDLSIVDSIQAMLMKTKDNINNIPNNGIGYGLWKYMKQEGNAHATDKCEEISFNYLGELDNNLGNELFSISKIKNDSDQSKNMCMLAKFEITAAIYNKCMRLEIAYDKNEFTQSEAQRFLSSIVRFIKDIVKYCSSKEEVVLTISDFQQQDISLDEILEIQSLFQ